MHIDHSQKYHTKNIMNSSDSRINSNDDGNNDEHNQDYYYSNGNSESNKTIDIRTQIVILLSHVVPGSSSISIEMGATVRRRYALFGSMLWFACFSILSVAFHCMYVFYVIDAAGKDGVTTEQRQKRSVHIRTTMVIMACIMHYCRPCTFERVYFCVCTLASGLSG